MPPKTFGPGSWDAGPKRTVTQPIVNSGRDRGPRWCRPVSRIRRTTALVGSDAPDLVDRVGLAIDRQQRGRLGEIDRIDYPLYLGRDSHGIARGVGCGSGQLVLTIRPLRAVIALAVPAKGLIAAGVDGVAAGEDGLPGAVGDRDGDVGIGRNAEIPGGRSVGQGRGAAVDHRGLAG